MNKTKELFVADFPSLYLFVGTQSDRMFFEFGTKCNWYTCFIGIISYMIVKIDPSRDQDCVIIPENNEMPSIQTDQYAS